MCVCIMLYKHQNHGAFVYVYLVHFNICDTNIKRETLDRSETLVVQETSMYISRNVLMPTHYQHHGFIKYSLKTKKSQQALDQEQQDASKIIVILKRRLQDQQHRHMEPSTRKKRRGNSPDHPTCKSPPKKHTSVENNTAKSEFEDLITELEFSYDCLATINVVYNSLRHTYTESKWSIEQQGHVTRLCDMEKELLIAYDDLNLQINQLEKSIIKMEQKLIQLKSM
ncbi:hypothetical protein MBANPS3_002024 [Mucor bainieri]